MANFEKASDLLDALLAKKGWPSDYRISKELGIPLTTISSWRTNRSAPDDDNALAIAHALEIDELIVLAICKAQRSNSDKAAKLWRELARQIARGTLPALGAFLLASAGYTPPAEASVGDLYIRSNRRKGEPEPQAA